jgi:pyridoxal 5'-phosphate synthase pdxS subunit
VFKSGNPRRRARAIVDAVAYYNDAAKLAEISTDLGGAMVGINAGGMEEGERLAVRGW